MKTSVEDIQCVWMTSGMVAYKLCDRRFECEHCEFDKVMNNSSHSTQTSKPGEESPEESDMIDRLLNGLMYEHQHKRSIYLPNNLVLDELADHTFRLSLSSLAGHFLDNTFSMVPCRQGEEIRKGQPCITLSGAWGGMTVFSPIHFLYQDKSEDNIQHDLSQWIIGIIQAEKNEIAREQLSPPEWQQQIIELSRKLIQYKTQYPETDQNVNDAGVKVKYLYQRIGKPEYLDLLNFLFRQKIKTRGV